MSKEIKTFGLQKLRTQTLQEKILMKAPLRAVSEALRGRGFVQRHSLLQSGQDRRTGERSLMVLADNAD